MLVRPPVRNIYLLTALLAAAAFIYALAPLVPTAHARPGVIYGVEQDGGMDDPTQRAANLDHQALVGARIVRIQLRFDLVAANCDPSTKGDPTDPANPCYDWSTPDGVAQGASQRNMAVIFSVMGVPKWEFPNQSPYSYGYTGDTPAQFDQFKADYVAFVAAAARRYDGSTAGVPRVLYWTIWNEPNGGYFWTPRSYNNQVVVPTRYAELYDASARALKGVDSTLHVAAGPLASTSPLKPQPFLQQALPIINKLKSPIDAWAQNAYTRTEDPLHSHMKLPEIGLGNLQDLTALLDKYPQTKGKPIWITEFGFETPPEQTNGVSFAHQAEWLASASYLVWKNPRVNMFIWYGLFDDGTAQDPTSGFQSGLYQALSLCQQTWCPKLSAQMYQHPLWISSTSVAKGHAITIWGQGRVQPASTKIYYWQNGAWQYFYNKPQPDGVTYLTWKPTQSTWLVTCDISCGGVEQVTVK